MGVGRTTARTLGFSAALVTLLLAGRAHAVVKTWIGSDGGSYSTPANWDPSGTPGTADSLVFASGGQPSIYDINFDTDATVTQLTVATNPLAFAGASRTLSLTGPSLSTLLIGRTGSGTNNAALGSSLAQLNTTYAVLGADSGSTGTLTVTAGTFSVSGTAAFSDLVIGDSGTGTINVLNGADVTVAGDTGLATFGAAVGNISVTGSGSTWTSTGAIRFAKGTGTIMVAAGGTLSASSLSLGFGGVTLAGNSNVTAAVSNNLGTVAPTSFTSTFGTLQITGSYTQGAGGKLQIEIHSTDAGSFDRLGVSGPVTLAGTLQVTLSSYNPAQNSVFDILDFTTATGTFNTVSLPALTGSLEWDTSKLYTDGTIRVVLPGDFNGSGVVDVADYAVWRKGLGTTYTPSDYNVWRTHFGRTAAGTGSSLDAATSIPESASLTLALLSTGAVTIARRRQRDIEFSVPSVSPW